MLYLLPFPSLFVLWMNIYEVGCSVYQSLMIFVVGPVCSHYGFSDHILLMKIFAPLQYSQFFCWLFGSIETRIIFFLWVWIPWIYDILFIVTLTTSLYYLRASPLYRGCINAENENHVATILLCLVLTLEEVYFCAPY